MRSLKLNLGTKDSEFSFIPGDVEKSHSNKHFNRPEQKRKGKERLLLFKTIFVFLLMF
jgi:hypothetical protein